MTLYGTPLAYLTCARDAGHLAAVTASLGNTTTRTYDAVSRLLTSTDPLGRLIWYTYDFLNRLSTVADPRQGLTPFTYDANGNILTVQDALGQTTTHARGDRRGVGSLLDPEGVRLMPRDKGRM